MTINTSYAVRLEDKNLHGIFKETVSKFRIAVDFFIGVRLQEFASFQGLSQTHGVNQMERLTHATKKNPAPKYDFDAVLYKFPSYYRRAAIAKALGLVSSYESNMENWNASHEGKKPSLPKAGNCFPTLYHKENYARKSDYCARVKVWIHNTWDWVQLSAAA